MPIDEKAAFYWRHRERIEEWAALAPQARVALCESLIRVALTDEPDQPHWELTDGLYGNWQCIRLPLDASHGVHTGVYWDLNANSGRGYWPEYAISASPPRTFPEYPAIKARLGPVAAKYGMTRNVKGGDFLWFGAVPLRSDLSIDDFATATLATVKSAHAELLPPTSAFFLDET